MVSKKLILSVTALVVAIAALACTTERVVEVPVEREVIRTVEVEVPVEVEKEVIREVAVEVPVEVEKEVIREVAVEVPVEVEKEVIREVEKEVAVEVEVTREVEKEVQVEVEVEVTRTVVEVATATPIPTATPLPIVPVEPAPQPKNEYGEISVAVFNIAPGVGLGSAQAPVEAMQYWGVGEGLFAVDNDGRTVGKLATDWELAADLSIATVTLREDVVFHDGYGSFSADDVVFTMNDGNSNTNSTSIHGQAGDFAAIFEETTKIDDYTVQFNFTDGGFDPRWNGNFLNEQAQGTAFFSKAAFDQNGADWLRENIVSTGPFEVVEWIQDDRAVLSAVDYDHWFATPEIQTLRFTEVPEPSTRVAFLRTGDVDIAEAVPLKDIRPLVESGFKAESITRSGRVHQIIFSGNYWEDTHARTGEPLDRTGSGYCVHDIPWVGCNIPGKQAGDMEEAREVRWALAKAIDRELLVETILDGFGTVGSIEYVDTTADYFDDRWLIPYNPEEALAHMAGTAWPTGRFPIGIWTGGELGGSSGTNAEINDAVAGMWKELWPDMDLQVFKSAYSIIRPSLVGRTNTIPYAGDCDEGSTAIPFDWPHGLTETSLTRGGFGCGIEIPEIASTFQKVAVESDLAERVSLNSALVDYLYDQMIFAGTVQVPVLTVYNPNSIAEWVGTSSAFAGSNEFEHIKLVQR